MGNLFITYEKPIGYYYCDFLPLATETQKGCFIYSGPCDEEVLEQSV